MLQNICRTCLAMEGELSPIYDSTAPLGGNCIADMLGDLTNHTPKKSDGMPEMVCLACIREINRCYFFKIKCLNSESLLKQFLNSCEEDQDADITDALFEDVVAGEFAQLPNSQVDIPNVDVVTVVGEPYIVIDLQDESERLEIKHEVEKQMLGGCILPRAETPDVEFVENEKVPCIVIDSDDEERESLQLGHDMEKILDLLHEKHVPNADVPIEKIKNPESQADTPDIEFVETAKESHVVISSNEESLSLEIVHGMKSYEEENAEDVGFVENGKVPCVVIETEDKIERMEVENDADTTFSNKENENVENTLKTDDDPYVVIDLQCESERLEIEHEVQKHLQLLHSNNENENLPNAGDIPSEKMQSVDAGACILPQVDELVIVVDSEDETVQFVMEHSRPNAIKKYSKMTAGLLKIKDKPSFTAIQSAVEDNKVSNGEAESDQSHFAPPAQKLQCTKCPMTFLDPTNLKEHVAYCGQCTSSTLPNLISNESINDDSAPETTTTTSCATLHRCPVCQECFAHRLLLTHHMRLHPNGLRFYCSICKRGFTAKSNLDDHMLRHDEKKPNKCDECPQSFYSIEELRLHVRGHTGDSPFVCDLCQPFSKSDKDLDYRGPDKYSDQKENVVGKGGDGSETNAIVDVDETKPMTDDDTVTHQRQRYMQAYRCFNCGAGFEQKESLETHIAQFKCSTRAFACFKCKRRKLLTCNICKKIFPNGEDLLKHKLEMHKLKKHSPMLQHRIAKLFKCEKCPRAFISKAELKLHFRRH